MSVEQLFDKVFVNDDWANDEKTGEIFTTFQVAALADIDDARLHLRALLDQGWVRRIDGRSLVHWCATRKGFTEAT